MRARRMLVTAFALSLLAQLLVVGSAIAEDVDDAVMQDFEFNPGEIFIDPGDSVTWTNLDPPGAVHTVTRLDDGTRLGQAEGGGGDTGPITFTEQEVVNLFCELHPEMRVDVYVGVEPPPPVTTRLTAPDNTGTAVAWSQDRFGDGEAPYALLARDDDFADSLASGGAQGALDAPLLLTPRTTLDARTRAELDRLGTTTVYVLGGPDAVSDSVVASLTTAGFATHRVFGPDRIATAVEVAQRFYPGATTAILARAYPGDEPTQGFADSLAAGALSARTGIPALLSRTDALSGTTKRFLEARPITDVIVAGGTGAISAAVVAELETMGIEVDRAGGASRVETAVELMMRGMEHDGPDGVVYVDAGKPSSWADGFAAAGHKRPVLLTSGDEVPGPTMAAQLSMFGFSDRWCGTTVNGAACGKIDAAASSDPFSLAEGVAVMEGGAGEDQMASGAATIASTSDPGALCFNWFVFDLDPEPTAAHIHRMSDGGAVVDLGHAGQASPGDYYGCTFGLDPALVADILGDPGSYYVNVHNATYPGGAIKGQLFHPMSEAISDVIGGDGMDPTGVGFAFLVGKAADELCAFVGLFGLQSAATAVEVRERVDDAVAFTLRVPGPTGMGLGCSTDDDISDFQASPGDYYLLVTSEDHPDGALRGDVFQFYGPQSEAASYAAAEASAERAGIDPGRPFKR